MKRRLATAVLRARLARYPAAALLGPRQSGKTTLGRSLARRYYDAEQPADRVRLDLDWQTIATGRELVVIDEAQSWAEPSSRNCGSVEGFRMAECCVRSNFPPGSATMSHSCHSATCPRGGCPP